MEFVVYSHTDYLDILRIQVDHLKDLNYKTLLINKNDLDLQSLYSDFNKVIFYDDSLPYASRLLAMESIQSEYIFLTHDIDIVIHQEEGFLEYLLSIMIQSGKDRIDVQYYNFPEPSPEKYEYLGKEFMLVKQTNPHHAIYNVNPSIWKLEALMDIMKKFNQETYRTIERFETQVYCQKYNIYKLWCQNPVEMGYFKCLEQYKFLHISHGGGLLPVRDNGLDQEMSQKYTNILCNYKFNPNRMIRASRW